MLGVTDHPAGKPEVSIAVTLRVSPSESVSFCNSHAAGISAVVAIEATITSSPATGSAFVLSSVPLMVMSTSAMPVPSMELTRKLSISTWPVFSAWTIGLLLSSW